MKNSYIIAGLAGVCVVMIIFNVWLTLKSQKINATYTTIKVIAKEVTDMFESKPGIIKNEIDAKVAQFLDSNRYKSDAFGMPYKVNYLMSEDYAITVVRSAGPDTEYETDDDIFYVYKREIRIKNIAHKFDSVNENLAFLEIMSKKARRISQNPKGNFVLTVSNQSFAISPVDITILINGKIAISSDFEVGDQHHYVRHVYEIAPGKHKLIAFSRKGEAIIETEFEISEKRHWGELDFWYYPKQAEKKYFEFQSGDTPADIQ